MVVVVHRIRWWLLRSATHLWTRRWLCSPSLEAQSLEQWGLLVGALEVSCGDHRWRCPVALISGSSEFLVSIFLIAGSIFVGWGSPLWKTSIEKNDFSAWASTLNMGLINKGWYGMFVACEIWCLADVSSVSPSSEQTGELWGNQCLNSW